MPTTTQPASKLPIRHTSASKQWRLATLALAVTSGLLAACSNPPKDPSEEPLKEPLKEPAKTGLQVRDAYIKTAVPGRSITAAYATLHNYAPEPVCLSGFAAEFATTIELHETQQVGGPASSRVRMRRLPELCIEPGASSTLAPGGMHLMVMGLKTLPQRDAQIELRTTSGQTFTALFRVQPFNQ